MRIPCIGHMFTSHSSVSKHTQFTYLHVNSDLLNVYWMYVAALTSLAMVRTVAGIYRDIHATPKSTAWVTVSPQLVSMF